MRQIMIILQEEDLLMIILHLQMHPTTEKFLQTFLVNRVSLSMNFPPFKISESVNLIKD